MTKLEEFKRRCKRELAEPITSAYADLKRSQRQIEEYTQTAEELKATLLEISLLNAELQAQFTAQINRQLNEIETILANYQERAWRAQAEFDNATTQYNELYLADLGPIDLDKVIW
jgi:hypothetical protein